MQFFLYEFIAKQSVHVSHDWMGGGGGKSLATKLWVCFRIYFFMDMNL